VRTLVEQFAALPDPRVERTKRHQLIDIVVMAICAVICGAEGWEDIEMFAEVHQVWFETFLELPNGIPSHDTFRRVFARLEPEEFGGRFLAWVQEVAGVPQGQVVAIDGKTLRRSHDRAGGKAAIHMVSAWASANRLVLGQVKTDDKSNEITAIPELLRVLDLTGCIVTIDAMGCQRDMATTIVDHGAEYVLALKGNQGTLHADVQLFFETAQATGFKAVPHTFHQTVDGDHGRIETRRCWATSDIAWLDPKGRWSGLTSIAMLEAIRDIEEHTTTEVRFFITTLPAEAQTILHAVRSHWTIENSLHWVLDIAFREDDSRIRKGHAPQNFAVLRHIALNLLQQDTTLKRGLKSQRLKAGWDHDYLLHILRG
jgi:predicted transposase YbfD/YdcC